MENVTVMESYKKFEEAMIDCRKVFIEMFVESNDCGDAESVRAFGKMMNVIHASMNLVAEQSRALDELNRKVDILVGRN